MAEAFFAEDQHAVPLNQRIIRSRMKGNITSTRASQSARVERSQKNWAGDPNIQRALNEIERTGKNIPNVAEEYQIPKSTLQDYANVKVQIGSRQGPEQYLNDNEEQALEQFILGCADVGYPKTVPQVLILL